MCRSSTATSTTTTRHGRASATTKHYQDDPRCANAPGNDKFWTYWQLHHCLLAGLSGFNQLDDRVAQYLIGAGKAWLDHGVDDFRLDAIKFVFPEFVPEYTHAMIDHLAALRRPYPYIVGEWSNGGVGDEKSLRFANDYARNATNILDFQLAIALNQFVGGDYETARQRLSADGLDRFLQQRVTAFQGRDTWQGTFIDNHDQIRTMVRLQKLGVSGEAERERRLDLALTLLLTVRGIPIVLYGDEQYLAYYADLATPPADDINTGKRRPVQPSRHAAMEHADARLQTHRGAREFASLRPSDLARRISKRLRRPRCAGLRAR